MIKELLIAEECNLVSELLCSLVSTSALSTLPIIGVGGGYSRRRTIAIWF